HLVLERCVTVQTEPLRFRRLFHLLLKLQIAQCVCMRRSFPLGVNFLMTLAAIRGCQGAEAPRHALGGQGIFPPETEDIDLGESSDGKGHDERRDQEIYAEWKASAHAHALSDLQFQ